MSLRSGKLERLRGKVNYKRRVIIIKIKVIDSIMGSGKTHWAIEKIKSSPNEKFIYITPYLDEIKRVREATNDFNKMYEPLYIKGSKYDNLHKLLSEGKNICSTHALFRKANNITREALKANNYILILDEVMSVVEELEDFTKDDFITLTQTDNLAYIEDDFLLWNPNKMDYNGRYNDIMNMALNRNLIYINDQLMFWNFPVDIFSYFKEVYVLTYLFDAQIQKYYYDFYNVEYERYQVRRGGLLEFNEQRDNDTIKEISKLIDIYDGKINSIGDYDYALSVNWYKRDDGTLQAIMKKNLNNWFNNLNRGTQTKHRLWTVFKDRKDKLKGKGYTNQHISINIRATNEYKETYILAYCCNIYVKPNIELFFNKRGIQIAQDAYALSEMLQWIWRSRIREGKDIKIYIPSKRMRNLLISYLQPKS